MRKFRFSNFFFSVTVFILLYIVFILYYYLNSSDSEEEYNFPAEKDFSYRKRSKLLIYPQFSSYPPNHMEVEDRKIFCNEENVEFFNIKEVNDYLQKVGDFPFSSLPIGKANEDWMKIFIGEDEVNKIFELKKQKGKLNMAIIIPVRNRCFQLRNIVPYLHNFLSNFADNYRIFVIEHSLFDSKVFNKAASMNVGYYLVQKEASFYNKRYDFVIFHDVDTLVLNVNNSFNYFPHPLHRGVFRNYRENNRTEYFLSTKNYFGAIVQFPSLVFEEVNGFSSSYWGWGSEDDDMMCRVQNYNRKAFQNLKQSRFEVGEGYRSFHRVPNDFGRVWQFKSSTERYDYIEDHATDFKNFLLYKSNVNRYHYFSSWSNYYLPFSDLISQSDGLNRVIDENGDPKYVLNEYHLTSFVSFYSISLDYTIAESREWPKEAEYNSFMFLRARIIKLFKGGYSSIGYSPRLRMIRNTTRQIIMIIKSKMIFLFVVLILYVVLCLACNICIVCYPQVSPVLMIKIFQYCFK